MSALDRSIEIRVPTERVWRVVGDFDRDREWRGVDEMVSQPPGPAKEGTRTHEVLRFLGSTYVTDAEVVEVVPGELLVFEGSGDGTTVRGSRRVVDLGDRTRYESRLAVEVTGSMRAFAPLLRVLLGRRVRRELRRLRALLETR
jgi:uncharacterized protein YndB with AHSA1/START domain